MGKKKDENYYDPNENAFHFTAHSSDNEADSSETSAYKYMTKEQQDAYWRDLNKREWAEYYTNQQRMNDASFQGARSSPDPEGERWVRNQVRKEKEEKEYQERKKKMDRICMGTEK